MKGLVLVDSEDEFEKLDLQFVGDDLYLHMFSDKQLYRGMVFNLEAAIKIRDYLDNYIKENSNV